MSSIEIKVEGMTCPHCAGSVKKAIEEIEGVTKVDINIKTGKINIEQDHNESLMEEYYNAIESQGFDVVHPA